MSDSITNPENVTMSCGHDDGITATASPRPWRVNGHSIEANDPDGLWLQNEKTGWGVVANLPSCPKSRMSKRNRETWDAIVEANAALIVDAVNERDRLRDLVRRLLPLASERLATMAAGDCDLLREALEAIGEGKE
jgi:hypothetical protein